MYQSYSSVLCYPQPDGVYVHFHYPHCDQLLSVLPDFFHRHMTVSANEYSSVIPYDEIPSGDRSPSCYVFESVSLGIAELEQRRAGIY